MRENLGRKDGSEDGNFSRTSGWRYCRVEQPELEQFPVPSRPHPWVQPQNMVRFHINNCSQSNLWPFMISSLEVTFPAVASALPVSGAAVLAERKRAADEAIRVELHARARRAGLAPPPAGRARAGPRRPAPARAAIQFHLGGGTAGPVSPRGPASVPPPW